ncbi:MAG: hypothetical protein ACJAUZ_002218, partial [Flavobacteriaceae bacterium]
RNTVHAELVKPILMQEIFAYFKKQAVPLSQFSLFSSLGRHKREGNGGAAKDSGR